MGILDFIFYLLHLVGSAMLVVLIAFIIVDMLYRKENTKLIFIGRLVLLAFLFIALLRT